MDWCRHPVADARFLVLIKLVWTAFSILALGASARAQCLDWSEPEPPAGLIDTVAGSGSVHAFAVHDDGSGPALYVAGQFAGMGAALSTNVARWNGSTFEPLAGLPAGSGPAQFLTAVGIWSLDLGGGPEIYAAQNVAAPNTLMRWAGSQWVPAPGPNALVKDLVVFDSGHGPELHAALEYGSSSGANVQRLSPAGWVPLGLGLSDSVNAIEVYDDGSGPELYIAGFFGFTAAGGPLRGLARWSGTAWVEVAGSLQYSNGSGGYGFDLDVHDDGSGAKLVVGGHFHVVGGQNLAHLAAWNGSTWSSAGVAVDYTVVEVESVRLSSGSRLVVSGLFSTANSMLVDPPILVGGPSIVQLGPAFSTSNSLGGGTEAYVAHDDGSGLSLFVGGRFASAGYAATSCIARYDETNWHALGVARSIAGQASALERHDDGSGVALYLAGSLDTAGDRLVRQVARYDGASWTAVGPISANQQAVRALESADVGDGTRLYAGGDFQVIAGTIARAIAQWDGATWSPLAGGGLEPAGEIGPTGYRVQALAEHDDGTGRALFVGGYFAGAGGVTAANIARWTPAGWSNVGAGLPGGLVLALEVFDDGTGPDLYAGGNFTGKIARWDGVAWQGLPQPPSGSGGTVLALGACPFAPEPLLFVGGRFSTVGGVQTLSLAAWTGASWRTFGVGAAGLVNSEVRAFHLLDDGASLGPRLFAAGRFGHVDALPVASVVAWNGAAFEIVPGGVNGSVSALGSLDDGAGPSLFAAGAFTLTTGGVVAQNFARFGRHGAQGCEPTTGTSTCDGSGAGAACPCGNIGIVDHGCANSVNTSGATLSARGAANVGIDSVTLDLTGATPSGTVLFFQGTSVPGGGAGLAFGDGVRCVSGTQIRLAVRVASGGSASFGAAIPGDLCVSVAGAVPGGATRRYQAWYRDAAAFCTSSTFNLSNGLEIRWAD